MKVRGRGPWGGRASTRGGSWSRRTDAPELMDLPGADEERLLRTVRQFELINRLLTRSRGFIRRHILRDAVNRGVSELTLLDIGAGGCDIGRWFVAAAARRGITARVICLDYDRRIVDYAREQCAGNPEISVVLGDAGELGRLEPVDYIFANHFLHHLPEVEIPRLLSAIAAKSRHGYLINDLRRSRLSYFGYTILAGLLFRRSFAFHDGRLSIRRGFLPRELAELVREGDPSASVGSQFPGRVTIRGGFAPF